MPSAESAVLAPDRKIHTYRLNSDIGEGGGMGKHSADTTLSSALPTAGELLETLPDGWHLVPGLHDLVPDLADGDQVVVGPGGIFVVVAPEWVGPFSVDGNVVTANGVTRERETGACLDTAVAVAMLAGTYAEWIVPVLCLTSEELLLDWAMEARVCSLASLLDALTDAPVVLPPSHVNHAAHVLRTAGEPPPVVAPVVASVASHAPQPAPEPAAKPAPAPVAQPPVAPVEPNQPADASSSRSRRVAAAMAAAEAAAAQVAADAAARGEKPAKQKKARQGASRIRSLVALVVAAAVVGVLALNGPRLVPTLRDVYDQLSGAPTCVPTDTAQTRTVATETKPVRVPRTDRHGKPLSKAARAKARKKAAARAKRLALKRVSAPALEAAAC
jgi:hypothetical protein